MIDRLFACLLSHVVFTLDLCALGFLSCSLHHLVSCPHHLHSLVPHC